MTDLNEDLKYLINLPNIKFDELIKILRNEFYNKDLILLIHNIIENITKYDFYINKYFDGLQRIGDDTINSYAYSSHFLNSNNGFVIKTRKTYSSFEKYKNINDVKHEYDIGKFLNKLRTEQNIYNFAYVFGFFEGSLLIQNNNQVISYDDYTKDFKVGYVIYEYIYPSISLTKFIQIPTNTFNDFMKIYLQIVFALYIANNIYNYTHYDLHTGNILIKTLDKNIDLVYIINGEKYVIRTNKLAVIIDYDFSYIYDYERGYKYGIYNNNQKYNIYNDRHFFMFDINRLLTTSLYDSIGKNTSIQAGIFRYLNNLKNNINLNLKHKVENGKYFLEEDKDKFINYSHRQYIEDIKSLIKIYIIKDAVNDIKNTNLDNIYKRINLNINNEILHNIETFYILSYFKYNFDLDKEVDDYSILLKDKIIYISTYEYKNIDNNSKDINYNINVLKDYFRIYHIFNDIKYKYIIISNALKYNKNIIYLQYSNLLKDNINLHLKLFKDKLINIVKTYNFNDSLNYYGYINDIIRNFNI